MKIKSYLACITFLLVLTTVRAADAPTPAKQPAAAPEFTLPDLKGKPVSLSSMKGQAVVLNFWAFWCDTWKAELPHLKEMAKEQSDRDFKLVAINVDGTRLQEFMDKTKGEVGFPVLLDGGGKVSEDYSISHVPTVIILDPAGKIRYRHSGYPGNEAIRTELRRLSSEKSAFDKNSWIASNVAQQAPSFRRER